jgi:hypothetical protein
MNVFLRPIGYWKEGKEGKKEMLCGFGKCLLQVHDWPALRPPGSAPTCAAAPNMIPKLNKEHAGKHRTDATGSGDVPPVNRRCKIGG